jgi:hypothetical protein
MEYLRHLEQVNSRDRFQKHVYIRHLNYEEEAKTVEEERGAYLGCDLLEFQPWRVSSSKVALRKLCLFDEPTLKHICQALSMYAEGYLPFGCPHEFGLRSVEHQNHFEVKFYALQMEANS